jgi:hypothetical protein
MGGVPQYSLVLQERDGSESTTGFSSLEGRLYRVGDTLPVSPDGDVWRVVGERPADAPLDSTLVCERADS